MFQYGYNFFLSLSLSLSVFALPNACAYRLLMTLLPVEVLLHQTR